jgi:hypothetical protein
MTQSNELRRSSLVGLAAGASRWRVPLLIKTKELPPPGALSSAARCLDPALSHSLASPFAQ